MVGLLSCGKRRKKLRGFEKKDRFRIRFSGGKKTNSSRISYKVSRDIYYLHSSGSQVSKQEEPEESIRKREVSCQREDGWGRETSQTSGNKRGELQESY